MKRYDICRSCPEFDSYWKTCNTCKCFMPIKVLISSAKCPQGQWEKTNGTNQKTNEITKSFKRGYSKKAEAKRNG